MDLPMETKLDSAVKSSDLKQVDLLLRKGVNIYFTDENGLTPLHVLIQRRIELFESFHVKSNEEFSNRALSEEGYKHLNEPGAEDDVFLMSLYREDKKRRKYLQKNRENSLNDIRKKIEENGKLLEMILRYKNPNGISNEDSTLLTFHAACTLESSLIAENLFLEICDINQSVKENSPIYAGYTALHFAALCNNINMVKMLVTKGANLMIQDGKSITPLAVCSKLYSIEDVQSILNLTSAWKNIVFTDGKTKLMDYVSTLNNLEKHKNFLLNMGEAVDKSLPENSPLWPSYTVLHVAIILLPESKIEMFKDILDLDTNILISQDSHGSTPIHLAFRQNKLKVLGILFNMQLKRHKKAGNCLDKDNLSYLHIAASVNRQPVTKQILKIEKNFDIAYKGEPLPTVKPGWTALHTAAFTTHAVIARLLLQSGANLLATESQGLTAIHLLLGTNYTEKVTQVFFSSDQLKECVAEGIGLTHLHVATWKNKPQTIERLLELGSDIDANIIHLEDDKLKKFEGCRPIHIAMMGYSLLDAYKVLLKHGADILAKKLDGSSALSEVLTGKYDRRYLIPIVELIWSSEELQNRLEREFGITMLHLASYIFDEEKIQESLKKIDINARTRDDSSVWPGYTALHVLLSAGLNLEHKSNTQLVVDKLCLFVFLNEGADVTLANTVGDTPVLMALKSRHINKGNIRASFLMSHQRDFTVNPINKFGMSHFHVACLLYEVETVKKFLKNIKDFDVNQAVSSSDSSRFAGHTPLHLALIPRAKTSYDPESQIETVHLLLKCGANVHAVDAFGYTSLHKLCSCAPTRNKLWHKMFINEANINKRAVDGKTPIEILLWNNADRTEINYFLERGARINSYNSISDVGYMAIVICGDKYRKFRGTEEIVPMMMNLPDIAEISDTGRNAIHNAVSAEYPITTSNSTYGKWMKQLISFGCDILKQDILGRTPLHLAAKFQNRAAIRELLSCGADINIVDLTGKSPFSYALEFRKDNAFDSNACCKILAEYLKKLQLVGWQVSDLNAKLLYKVVNEMEDMNFEDFEKNIIQQLEIAKTIEMYKNGFTVREFLYQTGAINLYPSLKKTNRVAIDSFFKSSFPYGISHLTNLLMLQYKNAVNRLVLYAPAVNGLRELFGFLLPVLCVEIIFMYLTNSDLENMIKATTINDNARMIVD